MPNLGQPVTETAIRGRCGGERTNRRCGSIDTRKLHGRSRQQGGRRCHLHDSLRGDHLRPGPPTPGGPIEARDQASENNSDSRQSERPSKDAGGDIPTNKICRSAHTCVCVRIRICSNLFICRSADTISTIAHIQQFFLYHKPHKYSCD